ADVNVGTSKTVTLAGATLTGAAAGNYTLTSVSTTTANITQAAAAITFGALPAGKKVGDAAFSAGATTTLGTISYSSANTAVATVNASTGSITLVAPGVTTITATVSGTANFTGSTASQTLNVAAAGGAGYITNIIPVLTLPTRNSPVGTNGWTITNAPTDNAAADYWKMISNNAVLTTPSFDLNAYTAETCVLKLGTFGTVTQAKQTITVSVSTNNGSTFTVLTNQTPTSSGTNTMAAIDLSGLSGSQVQLRFANTNGDASIGVRFYEAAITGTGSASATPTITPSGTFPALTTTYGTPSSSSNSVLVSGGSLTADITATAPEGFEVSNNGATYGATATFAQTSGFANGTLYLRLAATAAAGSRSGNVTLSSTGATQVNVPVAASTVAAKALSVTAVAKAKIYGDSDPVFTYTSDGLVNGDSLTGSLSRVAGESVGTYAIGLGTLTNPNYNISFTGADLSVSAKAITVTADAKSKSYGGTDPALTYQVTSGALVPGDSLTGALSRVAGENVGTYAISSTLANANYDVTFVPASLTIGKAIQTITGLASADSIFYGAADYTLAVTKGASSSALSFSSSEPGVATIDASGLVHVVGAGTTTFTVNQAADANYNAAVVVTQTLTVRKIDQTITGLAATDSKVYGGEPFNLAATASSGLDVSYASSDTAVATVSGNVVTILKAGSTVITASQAGDNNYMAAPAVTQTLTVVRATPTITVAPMASDITYGQTLADSTLTGGTANTPGTFAFTTPSISPNVGTANQGLTFTPNDTANYNTATTSVSVTMGKANQTITGLAAADSKMYGAADYTLSVTKGASSSALSFSSSEPGVATIDASGLVHVVG
ncbi:MAG: hypothetical protein EBZ78_09840, partial [Verrucomicrobia bacterium]|nr:hypothetical protein [Verrucomicrobiota bacterium]